MSDFDANDVTDDRPTAHTELSSENYNKTRISDALQQTLVAIRIANEQLLAVQNVSDIEFTCQSSENILKIGSSLMDILQTLDECADGVGNCRLQAPETGDPAQLLETALIAWDEAKIVLENVQTRVSIAQEWSDLHDGIMVELEKALLKCQNLITEIDEASRNHRPQQLELETIENTLNNSPMPISRSNQFPKIPGDDTVNDLFKQLETSISPLRASLEFIPLRLEQFSVKADKLFPQAMSKLVHKFTVLTKAFDALAYDTKRMEQEVCTAKWSQLIYDLWDQISDRMDLFQNSHNPSVKADLLTDIPEGLKVMERCINRVAVARECTIKVEILSERWKTIKSEEEKGGHVHTSTNIIQSKSYECYNEPTRSPHYSLNVAKHRAAKHSISTSSESSSDIFTSGPNSRNTSNSSRSSAFSVAFSLATSANDKRRLRSSTMSSNDFYEQSCTDHHRTNSVFSDPPTLAKTSNSKPLEACASPQNRSYAVSRKKVRPSALPVLASPSKKLVKRRYSLPRDTQRITINGALIDNVPNSPTPSRPWHRPQRSLGVASSIEPIAPNSVPMSLVPGTTIIEQPRNTPATSPSKIPRRVKRPISLVKRKGQMSVH